MYLMAEQRVAQGSEKFLAIQASLTTEHLSNLTDVDYDYSTYVSGWDFGESSNMRPEQAFSALVNLTGMVPTPQSPHFTVEVDTNNGDYLVQACCAYWRKANAIHEWFVNNTQGGQDPAPTSPPIHGEVLADLIDRCQQVLETPLLAAKLLPTQPGFFFGSTDYDEWYVQELKSTVDMLTGVVESYPKPLVLRYRASW